MREARAAGGYFRGGMPYNRFGQGPRVIVVFQGLTFDTKPLRGIAARFMVGGYGFLGDAYTGYVVGRCRGLAPGCSIADLADDYATLIREELGGPVDVLGVSTGGSIALQFGADHADLVRRLVIHSSAHTLSEAARRLQLEVARRAMHRDWVGAYACIMAPMLPRWPLAGVAGGFAARLMARGAPSDPGDLVATIMAEDRFACRDRLGEIRAPTLVVAGSEDPFYTPELFRETAAGISDARLLLIEGMGHPASGRRFREAVRSFLLEA